MIIISAHGACERVSFAQPDPSSLFGACKSFEVIRIGKDHQLTDCAAPVTPNRVLPKIGPPD